MGERFRNEKIAISGIRFLGGLLLLLLLIFAPFFYLPSGEKGEEFNGCDSAGERRSCLEHTRKATGTEGPGRLTKVC